MHAQGFAKNCLSGAIVAGLLLACPAAFAAKISRLTPPSELFASGSATPVISRFMQGQRFDLQATVQPDAGLTITSFYFQVDGVGTAKAVLDGNFQVTFPQADRQSMVGDASSPASCIDASGRSTGKSGCKLVAGLPGNTVVVSQRGYAHYAAGVHTLKVVAIQSDGTQIS